MFPRVKKYKKNGTYYEYLVVSESVYQPGKGSTTKDIARLGNIKTFKTKDIEHLIDGLIKIFTSEKYSLTDEVEIIESLEHGSIIFWQKIWEKLHLSEMINKLIRLKDKRITLAVGKYIEMMTVNRCIEPLSKLGATRWVERTCYKEMKGYKALSMDVNNFYRSMDYLLAIKEPLESAVYERLRDLFNINVRMTFYDITSTYFYAESCPISEHGYSRDHRPDKVQIIIGVLTTYEGYPIKHYVFEGNTKDETTVQEVISDLKEKYNIQETTFVGDRGMITKLNLHRIRKEGYGYIMGVKVRQNEICQMLLTEELGGDEDFEEYRNLKIKERKVKIKAFLLYKTRELLKSSNILIIQNKFEALQREIESLSNTDSVTYEEYKTILKEITQGSTYKLCQRIFRVIKRYEGSYEDELRYIICLNKEKRETARSRRQESIVRLSEELDHLFSQDTKDMIKVEKAVHKVFGGYKARFRKFFDIHRDKESKKAQGYKLNKEAIEKEERVEGIFVLLTSREDIDKKKVVASFKNLQEVEILFDDFKNFVDVRPIRHWLDNRVRAHVFICILALLLKRVFEINYLGGKKVTELLEEISKSKLIKYRVKFSEKENRSKILPKVTTPSPSQKKYFNLVGIKNPESLEKFMGC
ncbi:MAG: IS1634 family transposase [Colwellia sp.]|nr:IS1634 family transposase [Colwellia sp.]